MTSATVPQSTRRGQLAQVLQELITVAARLRSKQRAAPPDAAAFRASVLGIVDTAKRDAAALGYPDAYAGYAVYAVVAFLDEAVLSFQHPAFAAWQGKPLQEELFSIFIGGDMFFEYLKTLLSQQDSDDLGDVLEVYQLCLLLGFKGRYGASQRDDLDAWTSALRDRLTQIRGPLGGLSPHWAPPRAEQIVVRDDPWQRRLRIAIGAVLGATIVLFIVFILFLRSGTHEVVSKLS